MNPLLVLLGVLGPLFGIGVLRGGSGDAKAPAKIDIPVNRDEPAGQEDPIGPEPSVPPSTPPVTPPTTPPATPPATPPVTSPPPPVTPPAPPVTPPAPPAPPPTPPTPPTQNPTEPDELPPSTSIMDSDGAILAGRVSTLSHEDGGEIASIKITAPPAHGNVTVNPDNTIALVMTQSDYVGSLTFDYEVTYADGSTASFQAPLDIAPGPQADGWGGGDHYMLATDENDDIIVEHGDDHRKVYVSGSDDALTLADIAALEGLDVSQISGSWLGQHAEYGSNPDMALASDAAAELWSELTGYGSEKSSDWLLFERGYEYDFEVLWKGTQGESELHPVHLTSYGEGERPVILGEINQFRDVGENVVISDVTLAGGGLFLEGGNYLFDNVEITTGQFSFQNMYGVTIRNSELLDVGPEEPKSDDGTWSPFNDRATAVYLSNTDGILVEGNLFDMTGWDEGYDPTGAGGDAQPPSQYSHSIYFQHNTRDVTFRDNISMRAASHGAQVRGGGFIEDNVFLDNNIGVNFKGGDYEGSGTVGEYTLYTDNVVTSAAHKESDRVGAKAMGVTNSGALSSMIDNIIAHVADPNNPDEIAAKTTTNHSLQSDRPAYYDDTIIFNWEGLTYNPSKTITEANTEGLNKDVLDQTTIQNFTAQLLGKPDATIADLADYLRAQGDGAFDGMVDADLIIEFFQQGFGITPVDIRGDAETLRFIPNSLAEGMRWDNRLNWNTEDLPGTQDGDSVDLGGNWVQYGGTTTIENLDFGSGGKLYVTHGYLNVAGDTEIGEWGAEIRIDGAGQYWTDGLIDDDMVEIDIDGGRFANTGRFDAPTQMSVEDNGQAILAAGGGTFDLTDGSSLELVGDDIRAGFDGANGDAAVLRMDDQATLSFLTDEDGQMATIEEFRSGAFGDAPNVLSGVNLGSASLRVDVSGFTGSSVDLVAVDELIGTFGDIDVDGLSNGQGAKIVVDYARDKVTLELIDGGAGQVTLETLGDELSASLPQSQANELWAALTEGQGIYDDKEFTSSPEEDQIALIDAA